MNGPGYSFGRAKQSDATVTALLNDGYNVLTWDPRGFGNSGGQVESDSPAFEARDVSALIDMVAQQPEVLLDKPGDPRLGMFGASYGGGIQNNAAAIDPRIDVIAPQIAWHSLITSLDKDNTAKSGWGSVLYGIGTEGSTTGAPAALGLFGAGGRQDPRITQAFVDGAATGEFTPADQAFFAAAGPGDLIEQIHIPTLIMEGTDDTLFTLHEAIENYAQLRANGVPVQMLWFCGGLTGGPVAHGVCNTSQGPDPRIDTDYALRWLDRWLKGNAAIDTGPRFSWISDDGVLHGAGDYPLPQGAPVTASGSGTLVMVPGDTSGALIEAEPAANAVSVALPTPATGTQMVGEPSLSLTYTGTSSNSDGRLYAQIVDNQSHLVLGNQVTPIAVTLDGQQHTLSRSLEGIAVDVTPGKSYTLQITDGANDYFAARNAGTVQLTASLSVPTVAAGASTVVAAPIRTGATPTRNPLLQCTRANLVLTDVFPSGRRVKLLGAADPSLIGKTVSIVFAATGKRVARAVVQRDGSFQTTAALPPKRVRNTNRARYQAVLGAERSLKLKLARRLQVTSVRSSRGRVTITGQISRPLGSPIQVIKVFRRVTCTRSALDKTFRPSASGRFKVTLTAPKGPGSVVYRLVTRVRKTTHNRKLFPTASLPRDVAIA
jgi:ABC-2 type transport system ATP-binding protein